MNRRAHFEAVNCIVLGRPLPAKERASRELERFADRHREWWQQENVVGMCVARKETNGKLGQICVQVLVERKMPLHRLHRRHKVPQSLVSPILGQELLTDVRAVGKARLEALITANRPVRPGYEVGNELGGAGTLSCVVKDRITGKHFGLSCAHVLAPKGTSSIGARVGAVIYCPSVGSAEDLDVLDEAPIGRLVRVAPLSFGDGDPTMNVDAALFETDTPGLLDARVAQLGSIPKGINTRPSVGLRVRKVGAISEQTHGRVQALALCAKVPYGRSKWATFVDQIGITSFTRPGDSGSLVVDEDRRAVGIHFASFDGMSLCTPMRRVLDALDCTLA